MFLLALTAFLLSAFGLATCFAATGSQAAIRAADKATWPDTGMPDSAQTNHPVSLREVRLANDASSPAALAAVSPDLAESDDLDHTNTTNLPVMTSSKPSASPHTMRGLGLAAHEARSGPNAPLSHEGRG